MKGYGYRNAAWLAVAPTTSSSFILGQVSRAIEPINSNYYIEDLAKGKFTFRNPALKKLLKEKGIDNAETWSDILVHGGSVQHMDALTDHEKMVFQTFGEIPQIEIIMQAADRQRYIDQAQSLNVTIHPSASLKDVNKLMIEAWKLGVKSLYYQRSTNPAQEFARSLLSCVACEA
jgi:ribonucleoside-diphosphate reductase alpha chain